MERDYFRNAVLSVKVPHLDLIWNSESSLEQLETTQLRSAVFYDESLPLYIQLDLFDSNISVDEFKSFATSIQLLLTTKVAGVTSQIATENALKPLLNKRQAFEISTLVVDCNSNLMFSGLGNDSTEKFTAIWKVSVYISHPRIRLFRPQVVIEVTASVGRHLTDLNTAANQGYSHNRTDSKLIDDKHQSVFLEEFSPTEELNIFETLTSDISLKDSNPRLNLSKVTVKGLFNTIDHDENNISSTKSSPSSRSSTPLNTQIQPSAPHRDRPKSATDLFAPGVRYPTEVSPNGSPGQNIITTISNYVQIAVYPAVNLRLKCTKSTGSQDTIIAILEIENNETAKFDVFIKSADLSFTAGSAILLSNDRFPLYLSPGENISLAYQLSHADAGLSQTRVKPITILLHSNPVLVNIENQNIAPALLDTSIGPSVLTKWDTIVDFGVVSSATIPHTPVSAGSASGSVKKLFKVTRIGSVPTLRSASGSSNPNGSPNDGKMSSITPSVLPTSAGVSISFSGPSTVQVGKIFKWKVFAINNSTQSKHLTLYIQPPDKGFRSASTSLSKSTSVIVDKKLPTKPELTPVLDQMQILQLYQELKQQGGVSGIVSLVNDVRIGPMQGHACYETEIEMLALSTGQFSLEGLAVIDLNSGDLYDCSKVLDVVITQ